MKNFKISVHIPFFVDSNFKKKNLLLNKVCKSYLKLSTKLKIFVHTNKITKKK